MRRVALAVGFALASAVAQGGRAYCVRVTSEHNADTTDLARFRNFHAWSDKQDDDLALAIWQYLWTSRPMWCTPGSPAGPA